MSFQEPLTPRQLSRRKTHELARGLLKAHYNLDVSTWTTREVFNLVKTLQVYAWTDDATAFEPLGETLASPAKAAGV